MALTRDHISNALLKSSSGLLEDDSNRPLVFWDGYGLSNPYSGIGRYAHSLAMSLGAIDIHPVLISDEEISSLFPVLNYIPIPRIPGLKKISRLKFIWPFLSGRSLEFAMRSETRSFVVHGLSNFNVPAISDHKFVKKIITLHDIIPLLEPKGVSKSYRIQFQFLLERALKLADKIICVSEWTRNTLLERFNSVGHKCEVIQNGVRFDQTRDPGFLAGHRAFDDGLYRFLTITRNEIYKNIPLIPRILQALPKNWVGYVVTDLSGKRCLNKHASNLINSGRLKVFTHVSETELNELYRVCSLLLHVSRFEGFCLPIAEAMVRGCGVIFQKGSAIDEIAHPELSIGLYRGSSIDDWAQACLSLVKKVHTGHWNKQVEDHLASLPTWTLAARKTRILYNTL